MTKYPSSVLRVLVATFFAGLGMSLSYLFLNFHLEGIGFSRELIGYANAVPAFSLVLFGVPAALVIPRLGYVRSLYAAVLLSILGAAIVAWAPNTWAVFAGLLSMGIGQGLTMGATAPLLTPMVSEGQRVSVFSWHAALGTGAGFLGNLVGGFLPDFLGGPGGVMWLVPLVLAFSLVPLIGLGARVERSRQQRFRLQNPGLWFKLILPQALVGLGAGSIMPFLNLYLEGKFNLDYEMVGGIFAFSALATMGAMLLQPLLANRLGKVGAIVAMQGGSLPFILMLAYVPFLPLVTLGLFIRGALMNAAHPVYTVLSMEWLADEERAGFMLAQSTFWNVGWAIGSSISGRVQDALGMAAFDYLFAGMLAVYSISTISYILFFGWDGTKNRVTTLRHVDLAS
ncbi:MAG TPA: MFS transporter [Ardenticatenaceae bacterium]